MSWPADWPAWAPREVIAGARRVGPRRAVEEVERRAAVARRWIEDAKPCERCGTRVLWRREKGRRVALDRLGRLHACP